MFATSKRAFQELSSTQISTLRAILPLHVRKMTFVVRGELRERSRSAAPKADFEKGEVLPKVSRSCMEALWCLPFLQLLICSCN